MISLAEMETMDFFLLLFARFLETVVYHTDSKNKFMNLLSLNYNLIGMTKVAYRKTPRFSPNSFISTVKQNQPKLSKNINKLTIKRAKKMPR